MIPLMRSLSELIVITQSRDHYCKRNESNKEINQLDKKAVWLPDLPSIKRRKWTKSKKAILRFFDELDYNNQIQTSYDLTLLKRQNDYEQHDAA